MKKIALICASIVALVVIVSGSVALYNKSQNKNVPKSFNDKLVEAHKAILLFDYNKAQKLYAAAIKQQPSNKILEEYLAFLVSQEDLKGAYKVAKKVLKYNPNHFLANLVNAAYFVKNNKLTTAINMVRDPAQDTNSFNNAVFAILSTINFFVEKQNEQFNLVSSQIKAQLPDFYYNQLILYNLMVKDYAAATKVAQTSVKSYPNINNIIIYSKLLYLKDKSKGINVFKEYLGDPLLTDEAVKTYIDSFPVNDVSLSYVTSDALFGISKYLSTNLKAAYINPDNILVTHVALMLNDKNPLARMQIAAYYMRLGDYSTALNNLTQIGKKNFYYRLLYPQISKTLIELGQTDKAVEVLSTAYSQEPTNPEPLLELGHLYYKKNNTAKSIRYYSEALKVAQDNNQSLAIWLAYYFRGIAYNSANNWNKAESDLTNALSINNKDPLLLNYLGYSWIDRDINIDKGLALVRTALQKDPNNPNFLDSYAWGLFKKGNYSEALKVALTAKKTLPLDFSINNHLGDIYWKLNDKNKAHLYWQAALNMNPNVQTKNDIEKKLNGELPAYLKTHAYTT